jgi:hypothetical protein
MVMPHVFHHQDVGKRAEQNHAVQENVAQRDFEEKYRCKSNYRNQTA